MSNSQLYVPSAVGRVAFDELDRVPWAELAHAYGTGKVGAELHEDVAATLRKLGDNDPGAFEDGLEALFSNLCHQGTIYQATAFSVPFLAAYASGVELTSDELEAFVAIFASIGFAASFEAPNGSHAGSHGPGVAMLTRDALRASERFLRAMALRNAGLNEVAGELSAMVRVEPPDAAAVAQLERLSEI